MNVDVILDTHVILWFLGGESRGRALVEPALADASSTVSFSTMSLAEIAVKGSIGKLDADVARSRAQLIANGAIELPFTGNHAEQLSLLPLHHRDPFDRMLIAQALSEDLQVVTLDPAFRQYADLVIFEP